MAFTKSTVGNASSGAQFAADVNALQLWEDAVDSIGGEQEALIITDIQTSCSLYSWPIDGNTIKIHGDTKGADARKIIAAGNAFSLYMNIDGDSTSTAEFEDLKLVGPLSETGYRIQLRRGFGSFACRRLEFQDSPVQDIHVRAIAADAPGLTHADIEDCISVRSKGMLGVLVGQTFAFNVKNCLVAKSASYGISMNNSALLTLNMSNTLLLDNAFQDIYTGYADTIYNVQNCVSSDDTLTATNVGGVGCAINKTAYTDYFTDWDNDDLTLKADDFTLWGIDSLIADITKRDYNGHYRTEGNWNGAGTGGSDIGPYDYVTWLETTVGSGGSFATLTAWKDAIKVAGVGGNFKALVISDIDDTAYFDGFTDGKAFNLKIEGDAVGSTKRILKSIDASNPIDIEDSDIKLLEVNNLSIDANNLSTNALRTANGPSTLKMDNCRLYDALGDGLAITAFGSGTFELEISNTQFLNNAINGVRLGYVAQQTSNTFRHCLFDKNDSNGISYSFNVNMSVHMYGCISVGNVVNDYLDASSTSVHLHECVSSDDTATVGHVVSNNCVGLQSDYNAYFADYDGYDYQLLAPDNTLWGINGQQPFSPPRDFSSRVRGSYDVGPYEYTTAQVGLVGWYKMDEQTGVVAEDETGSRDATMQGGMTAAASTVQGRIGEALFFNGSTEYMTADSVGATVDQSIAAWVKLAEDKVCWLVKWGKTGIKMHTGGTVQVWTDTSGSAVSFYNVPIPIDEWFHIIAVYNDVDCYLYVNGIIYQSKTITAVNTAEASVLIGLEGADYLHGALDDLRIYEYALGASQAYLLYSYTVSGVLAYWRLDEVSGKTATDDTGAYDATLMSADNLFDFASDGVVPGRVGNALKFDGVQDYVKGPTLPMGLEDRSVSAWVRTTEKGILVGIAGPHAADSTRGRHGLYFSSSSDSFKAEFTDDSGQALVVEGSNDVKDGNWHHGVVVYQRDGLCNLYIDGELADSLDMSVNAGVNYDSAGLTFDLGNYPTESGGIFTPANFFGGDIDEVRVFSKAITHDEVKVLYQLSIHYKFDEEAGQIAVDSGHSGDNGILRNFNFKDNGVEGVVGRALSFDGLTNFDVRTSGPINQDATSVAMWVKPVDDFTQQYISDFGTDVFGIVKGFQPGYYNIYGGGYPTGNPNAMDTAIPIKGGGGAWDHIVFTFDGTLVKGYLNARLVFSVTNTSADLAPAGQLVIGARGNTADPFEGVIDEYRVYNRALTVEEIEGIVGPSISALEFHYKLDENSGDDAADSSGNSYLGVGYLQTGATWVDGQLGGAWLGLDNNSQFRPQGFNGVGRAYPRTIATWLKRNADASGNNGVFSEGISGTKTRFRIYTLDDGRVIATEDSIWPTAPAGSITIGEWHHVAVTYDGSEIIVYVDGVPLGSGTSVMDTDTSTPMRACSGDGFSNGRTTFDDFRYYSRALSAEEILSLLDPYASSVRRNRLWLGLGLGV